MLDRACSVILLMFRRCFRACSMRFGGRVMSNILCSTDFSALGMLIIYSFFPSLDFLPYILLILLDISIHIWLPHLGQVFGFLSASYPHFLHLQLMAYSFSFSGISRCLAKVENVKGL